jgi:hypothetical protein
VTDSGTRATATMSMAIHGARDRSGALAWLCCGSLLTRVRILAISALVLVGCTVVYAGCASAGPRADFERDFREGSSSARAAWFGLLVTRYGCDTVLVKAAGTGPLATGVTTCTAASWVMPQVIRAWSDSTGVQEEWEYVGTERGGGGVLSTYGIPQCCRCTLTLRGRDQRDLRVSDITC